VDLPDVSIIPLLPPNLANDKSVRMMCEAFDSELRRLIADIPDIEIIPNLARKQITDNLLLDLLAWQFHCDFYSSDFSTEQKQNVILKSLDWHTRKGTLSVIEEIVSTVFSKSMIQEWFDYGGLPYRFRISTEELLPDMASRKNLIRVITSVKNIRSWLEMITSLINFDDEFDITDEASKISVRRGDYDTFGHPIKYNGAIKYDGHTVNDMVWAKNKYNGTFKYNGAIKYNGIRKVKNPLRHDPPFKYSYSSSISDTMSVLKITLGNFSDTVSLTEEISMGMTKHHFYNGAYKYNGAIKYDSGILFPLA
jgi:phage tail P2-like protein